MQYTSWLFEKEWSFLITPSFSFVGILKIVIPFEITESSIHFSRLLRIESLSLNPIPFRTALIEV